MEDKTIIIHGNINTALERIELMAKEREEQERKERAERFERERIERERKANEWKNEHPILDKYTYICHYNYDTYSWIGNRCNAFFYEWSNIHSNPISFPFTTELYKFLDRCKINLTDEGNNKIQAVPNNGLYIICKPNSRDIIIAKSYDDMCKQFAESEQLVKILSTVPEI